jgi:LysM repeat protein
MNKILTLLVGCSAICFTGSSYAVKYSVTEQQKQMAKEVSRKGIAIKYIRKNAPSHYIVKSGDTLWEISSKFLLKPVLWPALWGANKDKIVNPHLIYPGQHLYLIKKNGYAYLSTSPNGASSLDTIRLSPKIRVGNLETKAVPMIPESILKAFVVKPMVLRPEQIQSSGRVIAGEPAGKRIFSTGDILYVRGEEAEHDNMHIFRPAKPIYNPNPLNEDGTKSSKQTILAYEAEYVGMIKKMPETKNDVNTFKITETSTEAEVGDIVLPMQKEQNYNLEMKPAPDNIHAFVAKVYGGSDFGAKGFVIVVNKGEMQGIKAGHILQIVKRGKSIIDTTNAKNPKEKVSLPNRAVGFAVVFSTHDNISYAFISDSDEGIEIGDFLISEGDKI